MYPWWHVLVTLGLLAGYCFAWEPLLSDSGTFFGMSLQAAAEWVLECSDITTAEEEWRLEQEEKEQQRQQALYEQQRMKKQLVEKFDMIKVPDGIAAANKKSKALDVWPANRDKQPAAKVSGCCWSTCHL